MFRYNNGQFKQTPPAKVEYNGFYRRFADLSREEWNELGYNEAIPLKREAFTTYETRWVKGDDLIYREEIVSAVEDVDAKNEAEAASVRTERDRLLAASDWTQLPDCPLASDDIMSWAGYRQALRDLPQSAGFPSGVEWPQAPTA